MKILVTGATSGLGRNASEYLLERGIDVVACGRNQQAGEQLSQLGATFIAVELAELTVEEAKMLMAGCDAIWHCAALSSPWGKRQDFEKQMFTPLKYWLSQQGKQKSHALSIFPPLPFILISPTSKIFMSPRLINISLTNMPEQSI
ncbi:NAD-dependent epimerase/dehydratase [Providencia rettgeri Dmel1]|nr:NAD-dependent epimerase/dehydratase [Providencia rettgeri Dmel1]